jgi:CHAT domain-containing protein/pimeloyl-ACP methyl ester carboxylesterase
VARSPRKGSKTTSGRRRSTARRAPASKPPGAQSKYELKNDQIESALLTGEHAGLLEDYFGPAEYADLRQLSREAAARTTRGGPRVLILPGIMGSRIGRRGRLGIFDDVYWFDPLDIAAGRLTGLALPPRGRRFEPLGVLLFAYLKLKLRLQIGGYDAEFYAFDWRQSIADLGKDLVGVLNASVGEDVSLVAHSMGGLVARWALAAGGKCRRLIMLGTPNFGSFVPVQALRGTYSVVRKVAVLDLRHTAEQLAATVFNTFPGLTEMLPFPERYRDIDLYDLASWPEPETGLLPRAPILAGVRAVQRRLAPADNRFFLIAGVDQETVTGLQRDPAGGFTYSVSNAGDGTVPLEFARLPETPTFYISEGHGSLPNNRMVGQAVLDLLDRGETTVLPRTYDGEARAADVRQVREDDLRIDPYAGRRGALLSQRELRTMLEEVAAPYARTDLLAPIAPAPVAAAEALEAGYQHAFDRIVVGRRRQHRIDLRFAFGSITEADTRAVAVGIFKDVAPSGAARALDQRVAGAITEVSRRRMFSGNVGEIFVLPTGRHAIGAEYVAFVGLGAFDRFTDDVMQIAAENLVRTFVNCHVEEFATVLFGGGSGETPASALRNLLTGFIRGLSDADVDHRFRRLVICERDHERYTELKAELYRLSSTPLCEDIEFTFDEVSLRPPPEIAVPARLRPPKDPVYLIVRQEQSRDDEFDVRTSILTAGQKATVVTGVRTVKERQLDLLIGRLVDPAVKNMSADGLKLATLLLSDEIRAVLPRHRQHHLVVVHDAPMSRVPWETMAIGADGTAGRAWFPAAEEGLTHHYAAENLSVAKWLEERLEDDVLTVLLVVNPTEDLDGAEEEGKRLRDLLGDRPGCRLEMLRGGAATRPALLTAFSSGKYDLIHYAGHAFFDPRKPERSGILCHGGIVLSGADLAGLGNLPTLVFFNACESGRIRRGRAAASRARTTAERVKRIEDGTGFAEAFMRGGVANFLATYWPVGDLAAKVFADSFYGQLMKGTPVREAIQHGRRGVQESGSKDWADYVFYGDPEFVVKTGAPVSGPRP